MAESVTPQPSPEPEAARQACEDWKLARFQSALTVNADDAVMDLQKWGDALAKLVPQLLAQLAAYGHAVDGFEDERDAFDIEATRMGERCRQSESALAEAQTSQEELATRVSELEAALGSIVGHADQCVEPDGSTDCAFDTIAIARAALGDTPPLASSFDENYDLRKPPPLVVPPSPKEN